MWRESDSLFVADSDDEAPVSPGPSGASNSTLGFNFKSKRRVAISPTVIQESDSENDFEDDDKEISDDDLVKAAGKGDRRTKRNIIGDSESENDEDDVNCDNSDEKEEDHIEIATSLPTSDYSSPFKKTSSKHFQSVDNSSDEGEEEEEIPEITSRKPGKFLISDDSSDEQEKKPETSRESNFENSSLKINSFRSSHHSSVIDIQDSSDEHSGGDLPPSDNIDSSDYALSLAREEAGSSVDPVIAQQKAETTSKLQQLNEKLWKFENIYHTVNRDSLPDRGEKLRKSIDSIKEEIQNVSLELSSFPKIEIVDVSDISIKDEPSTSRDSRASSYEPEIVPLGPKGKEMGKKATETYENQKALTVERIEHLQQSLNRCPEEHEEAENPRGIKTRLMTHQKHALAWMLWREKEKFPGGLLADDMGLGKTLTMISLIVATKENDDNSDEDEDVDDEWSSGRNYGRPKGGTLVVCPASLLDQWQNEVTNRCRRGVLRVELFHGAGRENNAKRLAQNDMVVTTYTIVSLEKKKANSVLYRIRWKRIILDEAHMIRNHRSQLSEAVCQLSARNRWTLTGTPVQNKEQDLYALIKFLRVSPFNDLAVWKRWVDNKNATGLKRLATVTKTLMLRRTKQELIAKGQLEELPEKFVTTVPIDLSPEETKVYRVCLTLSQNLFAQFLAQRAEKLHMVNLNAGKFDKPAFLKSIPESEYEAARKQLIGTRFGSVQSHQILVLILRLRQICCHPALIKDLLTKSEIAESGIEPDEKENIEMIAEQINNLTLQEEDDNENLFSQSNPVFNPHSKSSKIAAVINTVETIVPSKEKMVIVSQWTSVLNLIAEQLSRVRGANYDLFTGDIPVQKRQPIIDKFNDPENRLNILLLSLGAGGVGLNLVGGNHLLLIDIHWNPQLELQAQDRIYRFGQTKNVHVYKFLCNDTIEQRVKALQDKKLTLAEDIFTGHRRTSNKLSLDDMKSIFEM